MADFQKQGWVRFYRKSMHSSVWKNPIVWWVWSWCLLKANHQDNIFPFNGKDIKVKRGQFITGLFKASEELKLPPQKIRTAWRYLQNTGRIANEATNQFTLITILNWDKYQSDSKQANKPITSEQQTDNKGITTNKNEKNDNNKKNDNNNLATPAGAAGKEINSLILKFESVNPSYERLYPKKNQRSALERMVKKWGLEKVGAMIDQLPQIICQKYAPSATTPLQLEEKLGAITAFLSKNKSNEREIIM